MTTSRSPFDQACRERGWARPSVFLAEFAKAARLIGEQATITDRQFRRRRSPNPPRPHPRSWRVLHAMFASRRPNWVSRPRRTATQPNMHPNQ